jgi:two-component system chemotaxis response regulator CheY
MTKTVMVVDDSSSFRTVVKLALQKSGYEVVEASDGRDALAKLTGRKINLVVCDINMPQMDGITFVKQMKASAMHKFTPVIMLTTETQQSKKDEARAAGAKGWLTKPFQTAQLVEAVNKTCV